MLWGLVVNVTIVVTSPPAWETDSLLLPVEDDRRTNYPQTSRICYARLCVMLGLMRIVLCRATGTMEEEVGCMIERLESRCY